jgi:hypothetical protein
MITAMSDPGTRTGPDDGDRVNAMIAVPRNVLPSERAIVVGLKVARNVAEVKSSVLANCKTRQGIAAGVLKRAGRDVNQRDVLRGSADGIYG